MPAGGTKHKMKILMLHGHYSETGGAEVIINRQIAGLRRRGHDVLYFCFGDVNIHDKNRIVIKEPQSKLLRYMYQLFIHPRGVAELKKTIKSFSPDVIHLHNIDRHILTFLLPVNDCKTVRSVHDFGMVCPSFWGVHKDDRDVCEQGIGLKCVRHGCLNPLFYPLYYYLFKIKHGFQKKRVYGYIAATHLMKKYMERQGFGNIFVSPYFTDKRGSLTQNSMSRKILFVGKLEENKGCAGLLRAFKIVSEQIPDAVLSIVGSGAQEDGLKRLARSLNISAKVKFIGKVSNDDVGTYYRDTALVAVPSLCMDNSPIVIYEALSFGKPVVASKRGGIPELITNGYNGFLVDAGNPDQMAEAIMNLMDEKKEETYRIMSRNAFESSLNYTIDRCIDHLEAVYNQVVNAP